MGWERISCAEGSKRPRVYDWAAARLLAVAAYDGEDPTPPPVSPGPAHEVACSRAYAPARTNRH